MKMERTATLGICLLSAASALGQNGVAAALARLDAASAKFQSAQADFKGETYEALPREHTPQDGMMYIDGKGKSVKAGLKIVGSGARTLEYRNGTARVFNPAQKCVDIVTTKNKGLVESFLTLGFGSSGHDLASAWEITDQGSESFASDSKDIRVEKLDLVPKDQSVKNTVTHVTLWLDLERGLSLKQIIFSPSGDTRTANYSNIRLNQKIDTKPFEFKGPACGK
jgi:outer membrane lipoprotein-sorting protein